MNPATSLPDGFVIRPAQPSDRRLVRGLLEQFRREVVPPPSPLEILLQSSGLGLLVVLVAYLFRQVGMKSLLVQLLLGAGAVLGLGLGASLLMAWNEDWVNFWVIEYNSTPIACAKLRTYREYSVLYDLYVASPWRGRGLGSHLVNYLGQQATKPLYLACLPHLVDFYARLGFSPVLTKNLPPLLQYDLGIPGRFRVIPLVLS